MKILLLGSSQTKHVEKVFLHCGHEIVTLQNNKSTLFNSLDFIFKFFRCKMIYRIGGINIKESFFFKNAILLGKKVVIHWIGTDVLIASKKYSEGHKINERCINLAGSELLQKELNQIGIKSFVIPIVPTDFSFSALNAPDKHAILSYVPKNREAFYNMPLIKTLANRFPDVMFHIVSNDGENDLQPVSNIKYHGNLNSDEMYSLYKECSILFRFPEHDGLSMMLLEALGYGKTVVYCYDFPYVQTPKSRTEEDVIKTFENILKTPPTANKLAVDYINSEFSMDKQIQRYKNAGILNF